MKYEDEVYQYEEEPVENFNVTFDTNVWNKSVNKEVLKMSDLAVNHCYFPTDVADYLEPVFDGYMLGPTAIYKNRTLTAKTRIVNDIEDFKNYIIELDKPAFLYMIAYFPSSPVFKSFDENFNIVDLEHPEMSKGYWKVRYAVLEDECAISS